MFDYLKKKLQFVSLEVGPNYQIDDGFIALKQLIFGGLADTQSTYNQSKKWFQSYLKQSDNSNFDIYFTANARHGLYLLLKTLDLPHESEVLIQGFSCIVVPNAVLQASLKPITCDISDKDFNFDLDTLEMQITPNTKVWIVQHSFGLVIDINRVKEIAQKHNLILIEDCAHSLGANYNGEPVGCFGDAAIFSFGRDKIVSTTNGGAVTFNQKQREWQLKFSQEYNQLENSEKKHTIENLLYPVLVVFLIRPFYRLFVGKVVAILNLKFRLTGEIYTQSEKQATDFVIAKKYSFDLYPLLFNQLNKCKKFNDHRRKLAHIYAQSFATSFNPECVYLRFPLYLKQLTKSDSINFNSTRYSQIMSKTKKEGLYLGNWYTQIFVGSSLNITSSPYNIVSETIPNTTKLIQHQVINLPTNINTSVDEARQLCELIHNAR